MAKLSRLATVVAALSLSAAIAGCGGGGGLPGDVVAQVGNEPITQSAVNHWMSTLVGGDFYEISRRAAPIGLASDPENYPACRAALEKLMSGSAQVKPSEAQLRHKCEQLHLAIRAQAVSYLITVHVTKEQAAELGLGATPAEVERLFRTVQAREFPKETELRQYLAERHWSVADELFLLKRDLLSEKLKSKLLQKYAGASGQLALARYAKDKNGLWTGKTICRAGYVVQGCSEYGPAQAAAARADPSPAILIEELTGA
jgi:hypothetical protein